MWNGDGCFMMFPSATPAAPTAAVWLAGCKRIPDPNALPMQQGTGHVSNQQPPEVWVSVFAQYLHLFGAKVSHLHGISEVSAEVTHLQCTCGILCEQPSYRLICSTCKTIWATWYIWHAQKHRASISRGPTTLRKQRFTQEISRAFSAVWRHYSVNSGPPLLSSPGIALILLNQVQFNNPANKITSHKSTLMYSSCLHVVPRKIGTFWCVFCDHHFGFQSP